MSLHSWQFVLTVCVCASFSGFFFFFCSFIFFMCVSILLPEIDQRWNKQLMSKVTLGQGLIIVTMLFLSSLIWEREEAPEGCAHNLVAFLSNTEQFWETEARCSLMPESLVFYECLNEGMFVWGCVCERQRETKRRWINWRNLYKKQGVSSDDSVYPQGMLTWGQVALYQAWNPLRPHTSCAHISLAVPGQKMLTSSEQPFFLCRNFAFVVV